ncbi:MAG: hypothetical protein LBG19_09525 [Prevotellaceae bacterium]|jgi:short-subunit dehydrogenase involved in D-alanine esterification of teichoic acids|nr:hypothetical protein [Prevotellaceae bacterium]
MQKLRDDGIVFDAGIDPEFKIFNQFANKETIPINIIIDQAGVIKYTSVGNGEDSLDKLVSEIIKLLK